MSNMHRLTVAAYALNAVVFAWSASLPTGHAWHILACVVWVGLTGLAWHNGRNDARLREAARLSAMADGMSSVAGGVEHMAKEIGQVAHDIAAAAYGAAAEKRQEALAVLSALAVLLLLGCADAHTPTQDAGHTAPDLGPCARLAATLADAGPVARVVVYPDGHPCEGGTCQQGECIPRRGTGYPDHGPACADGEVCE